MTAPNNRTDPPRRDRLIVGLSAVVLLIVTVAGPLAVLASAGARRAVGGP
jgi:hypothetical protein